MVGAGLAGTATTIRLLHFARDPLEIVLLERRPDQRSAGIAYHRDGNPWDHVFNIQAGRMSLFREDVLDFVRWANREADRRDWPQPWTKLRFTEHGPAPRRIFQDYLRDRLAQAREEAGAGVELVEADGEVIDLRLRGGGVEATVRGFVAPAALGAGPGRAPGTVALAADQVVLATGLELKDPPFAVGVTGHDSFVRNPYSVGGLRRIQALPPDATVVIVGSVLSAYDTAALLLRKGHAGRIHLVSRSGTLFRTYPDDHEHGVVKLPCPDSLLEPYQGREEFLARVRTAWQTACAAVGRTHADIHPLVVAERVAKAWEPYLPKAIEGIPSSELRSLLDEFSTQIAALRVGAMEYTMAPIERGMRPQDGRVALVVARVESIAPTASGRLLVTAVAQQALHTIEADLVVSNFARESDYTRVGHPLWRNLLRRGLALPHGRTGRGVEVDGNGALVGADGRAVGSVSTVGVLREGDEIVRNGRTGAFTFNLAAIKNHSIAVAAHVLARLGRPPEAAESVPDAASNPEEAASPLWEEAVGLEVRRLAARVRRDREDLDARLDQCFRSLAVRSAPQADAARHDRLIRTAVNRIAVQRLTDVTVTPRQLRRQLGMANADDPED